MRKILLFAAAVALFLGCEEMEKKPKSENEAKADFYIATDGNDSWSGRLPAPNAEKTDGPFATLPRARDEVRKITPKTRDITVLVRGGTYCVPETITFGPQDSGNENCTIAYRAYPAETPILSGGRRISGWKSEDGKIHFADLPEVKAGRWTFRQLFADGRRQVRARFPNVDPTDPFHKGFLYAHGFGRCVGCIHNQGDWLEYKIDAPDDGAYELWVYYAALNQPHGRTDMAGRTAISVDGGPGIPLMNLPDTGGWGALKWSHSASVRLTKGPHVLKWQNMQGGGLNLGAFVLCDDPKWKPGDVPLPPPASGVHRLLIQASAFTAFHAPQLSVSSSGGGSKTTIECEPGTAKAVWAQAPDAEVHVFPSDCCRAFKEIVKIEGVDPDGRAIRVGGKECVAHIRIGDRYFVENVFEELDSPGEWYLDGKKGRLYYWPEKTPVDRCNVVAPVAGRMFELLGDAKTKSLARHIRISGFVIQETDYSPDDGGVGFGMGKEGVIYLGEADHCLIGNNRFVNVGKYGICAVSSSHNQFTDNEIAHGAEGGILLINSAANVVSNNYAHHLGAAYKHIGGVVLEGAGCSDNVVAHNVVHDSSRYGITLKGPGTHNVIEYNEVYNLNIETFDTGGIEVTQQNKEFRSGSIIRNNVVHDVGGYSSDGDKPMFCSWGIYLDSYAGGYEVCNNIVYRNSHGGLMIQGGKDNNVHNNIFVGSTRWQIQLNNFQSNSTGNRFLRNIVCYDDPEALLMVAYRSSPEVIQSDYNLYFHAGGKPLTVNLGTGKPEPFAEWQKKGFDAHSLVADPEFADPAKDDYQLKRDSPAFALGFKPIAAEDIGRAPRGGSPSHRP